MDAAMGIVGAIVIARWSWSLTSDIAAILLDRTEYHVADEIRNLVEAWVARITGLHVWRIGPEARAKTASIVTQGEVTGDTVRARLAPVHELAHLTVECR